MGYQDLTYAVLNKSLSWQMGYRLLSFEAETDSSGLLAGGIFALFQACGVAMLHKAPHWQCRTTAPASIWEGANRQGGRRRDMFETKN